MEGEINLVFEEEAIGTRKKARITNVEIKRLVEIIPIEKLANPKHKDDYAIVVTVKSNDTEFSQFFRLPRDNIIRKNSNLYRFMKNFNLPGNPRDWVGREVEIILTQRRGLSVWRINI